MFQWKMKMKFREQDSLDFSFKGWMQDSSSNGNSSSGSMKYVDQDIVQNHKLIEKTRNDLIDVLHRLKRKSLNDIVQIELNIVNAYDSLGRVNVLLTPLVRGMSKV